MHPLVRDVYKRLLLAGRVYPQGLSYVREKAKEAFMEQRLLEDETSIKKAVSKGRYWAREIVAVAKFHKFRAMRKYDPTNSSSSSSSSGSGKYNSSNSSSGK